jgi:hypothetical protein
MQPQHVLFWRKKFLNKDASGVQRMSESVIFHLGDHAVDGATHHFPDSAKTDFVFVKGTDYELSMDVLLHPNVQPFFRQSQTKWISPTEEQMMVCITDHYMYPFAFGSTCTQIKIYIIKLFS